MNQGKLIDIFQSPPIEITFKYSIDDMQVAKGAEKLVRQIYDRYREQ